MSEWTDLRRLFLEKILRGTWIFAAAAVIAGFQFANVALAADPPPAAASPPAAPAADAPPAKSPAAENSDADVVVATVGERPISARQVQAALASSLHGMAVPAAEADRMKAAMVGRLIERRMIEIYFDRNHLTATADEIDAQVAKAKADLEHAKRTWAEFLAKSGQTDMSAREELKWELSCQKYLKQQLTDDALEAYFKAHRRDFDGTQLRVSHILFRPAGASEEAAIAALKRQAEEVRQQIVDGKLDFPAAAEKYSAGPSRSRGGDLGIIGRHGPMVEPFSRAAFALGKDEISPPVVTPSGVHLIRVTEIKPGEKAWTDVREDLRPALTAHLLEQVVALGHGTVPVRFTGKGPYFKPGTTELVTPK